MTTHGPPASDITDDVRMREEQAASDARYRRLLDNALIPSSLVGPDGRFVLVNKAMYDFLGYEAGALLEMTPADITAPEYHDDDRLALGQMLAGTMDTYRVTKEYIHADGHRLWGELSVSCIRSPDGVVENLVGQIVDLTDQMKARAEAEEARRAQAKADALYRRSMESSAVGVCLTNPNGSVYEVNQALCDFFGYDDETLLTKTWRELTHPGYLHAEVEKVADMVAGRIDSYRMRKMFVHADGHPIWGDQTVGCLRNADGSVEMVFGQITDITEEVLTQQQNFALATRLTEELSSAAQYMRSTLPEDLHGQVEITSRYLPALELGGDGFHYRWLDEDHLKIYLIDVSGHGIRPALLSASVHNLMRTNSLPMPVLLRPDRVLNKLNSLFRMEDQGDSYFTIWYGISQPSTRTLRNASAGHPPALALNRDGQTITATALSTPSIPIGMFDDTTYTSATYTVPAGGQLLIYSDGAYELTNATKEEFLLSDRDFIDLCTTLAARPDWSLDTLVNHLKARSPHEKFEDDCALILATFP